MVFLQKVVLDYLIYSLNIYTALLKAGAQEQKAAARGSILLSRFPGLSFPACGKVTPIVKKRAMHTQNAVEPVPRLILDHLFLNIQSGLTPSQSQIPKHKKTLAGKLFILPRFIKRTVPCTYITNQPYFFHGSILSKKRLIV